MAGWLLTTSIGNLIVVILEGFKPDDGLAVQFFFFAILLAVVMLLFILMAYFYTYVDYGCEPGREAVEEGDENAPLMTGEEKEEVLDGDPAGTKEDLS